MKVSLAWIFDHISSDWRKENVDHIVSRFNQVTAEIEGIHHCAYNLDSLAFAIIDEGKKFFIPEWKITQVLPARQREDENIGTMEGVIFLVKREKDVVRWATYEDVGSDREEELPPFFCGNKELWAGSWKKCFDNNDVILDVDNKSLTHRPDMWGHRGFAREIAAFLKLPFKRDDEFLEKKEIVYAQAMVKPTKDHPITISVADGHACSKFSGLFLKNVVNRPSNFFMGMRLIRVGSRPISLVVDLTNYVMLDISQPMHAYDAAQITGSALTARYARQGESLVLLDGTECSLKSDDFVIADGEKPCALAGIMGGLESSINHTTTDVFLESAHFDPVTVRHMAARHGVRTEASSRFEKTLDFNQAPLGIQRFLQLARDYQLSCHTQGPIQCVGALRASNTIIVTHDFLTHRSGVCLSKNDVIEPLQRLNFEVQEKEGSYEIIVPSFRSSKDIEIPEDILEEVIRFYGYSSLSPSLPAFTKKPSVPTKKMREQTIRSFLSWTARMTEQKNYVLFDEDFLRLMRWQVQGSLVLKNPISQNQYRLVTTLLTGLFKNIYDNIHDYDSLRFFEIGRVWSEVDRMVSEKKKVAGIFFEKKKKIDFYECKSILQSMMHALNVKDGSWEKITTQELPWVHAGYAARIMMDGVSCGSAGMVDQRFLRQCDALDTSSAFAFELDADYLFGIQEHEKRYKKNSKYQGVTFDISCLIPYSSTTENLEGDIKAAHHLIEQVELIDLFEKKEWVDIRSLAFRIYVQPYEQTLTKDEIEEVRESVLRVIGEHHGELRE